MTSVACFYSSQSHVTRVEYASRHFNDKMATEQEFNIKFVGQVEKHPCLYNYTLADYTRKNVTEKAWIEVGKEVNLTRFQCKEKWKNIRTVYVRNLKESAVRKKKPYYLNSFMDFALPFIKTASNSLLVPENDVDEDHDPEDMVTQTHLTEAINVSQFEPTSPQPTTSFTPLYSQRLTSPISIDHSESSSFELPIPSNIKREPEASNQNEGLLEYLTQQDRVDVQLEKNPRKMFLLSLKPDLDSMTDAQMRVFKRRVTILVDEILGESKES